jgi:hypothetical protein
MYEFKYKTLYTPICMCKFILYTISNVRIHIYKFIYINLYM